MRYNISLEDIASELDFELEDVQMLLEVFLEGAKESLALLRSAIDENNLEEIYKSAHAIKGSAGNLTLNEIADLAKEIETSAKEEKEIDYAGKFEALKKSISKIEE